MTDLPPDRRTGEPHKAPEPARRENHDRGPRPGTGRQRSTRPPRLHQPTSDDENASQIRSIEVAGRPGTVPYQRRFRVDDTEWVAWVSGFGAYGTGGRGLATLQTLHFARADDPEKPLREVLMPTGRFEDLFDEELQRLFAESREVRPPEPGAAPQRFRRRGEGLS